MQPPHMFSIILALLITHFCRAYSPVQLESPITAPSCLSTSSTSCNFTNALEDVQAKILANNASNDRYFEGSSTSYVDCSECVYHRKWGKASIFWSQVNGTILLSNDWWTWTFGYQWNGFDNKTKTEIGYPTTEIQNDEPPGPENLYSYVQLQRGRIYERVMHPLYGPIYDAWLAAGGSKVLGKPILGVLCDWFPRFRSCSCSFAYGTSLESKVHWDSDTGAHIVWPRIMSTYEALDDYFSFSAISDATAVPNSDKSYMKFSIHWDQTKEAVILWNETESLIIQPSFWTYYRQHGGFEGAFGLPITNESSSLGPRSNLVRISESRIGWEGRALGRYQPFERTNLYASFSYQGPNWVDDWRVTAIYEHDGSLETPPPLVKFGWTLSHATAAQGEVFFTYTPNTQKIRLTTSLTFEASQTSNYTLVCLLRDGDGQFYTFSHSESLAGGDGMHPQTRLSERILSNDAVLGDIYQTAFGIMNRYPINWRALLFADPLDCRLGYNVDTASLRSELEKSAMLRGHYTFQTERWGGQGRLVPNTIELS